MVGATGFEPVTPAVSRQCSTTELRTHFFKINILKYIKIYSNHLILENIVKFRKFTFEDIGNILQIYNFHILNGLANFEENPLTYDDFFKLSESIININLPFIVCEDNTNILGFAYLNKFRNKSGYKFSYENTIYVHPNHLSKGIGSKLLKKLILSSSEKPQIKSIIAVIGGHEAKASIKIHQKNGFRMVGKLKNIGFKKNQWLDSTYMQLEINEKN